MGCVSSQEDRPLSQQRAEGKTVARTSSKGTSSRSKGFTTANGKTMEVLHDPHVPGGKRLVPTLTDAEDNPLMVRRKSKEALNGPVRRTTHEPADEDRSVRRSNRSKERDPNAPQRVMVRSRSLPEGQPLD
jgi:hypothetical protein